MKLILPSPVSIRRSQLGKVVTRVQALLTRIVEARQSEVAAGELSIFLDELAAYGKQHIRPGTTLGTSPTNVR
jgi:hypothetical protein